MRQSCVSQDLFPTSEPTTARYFGFDENALSDFHPAKPPAWRHDGCLLQPLLPRGIASLGLLWSPRVGSPAVVGLQNVSSCLSICTRAGRFVSSSSTRLFTSITLTTPATSLSTRRPPGRRTQLPAPALSAEPHDIAKFSLSTSHHPVEPIGFIAVSLRLQFSASLFHPYHPIGHWAVLILLFPSIF